MTEDLVMSVIAGGSPLVEVTWPMCAPYVISLERTGYKGKKVIHVSGVSLEIKRKFSEAGFTVLEFFRDPSVRLALFLGLERTKVASSFLLEHAKNFRNVIMTDCFDVIFQSDPSVWLEQNMKSPYRIVGCTDSILLKDGGINIDWTKKAAGEDYERLQLSEEEVLCWGTLAGESQAMSDLLSQAVAIMSKDTEIVEQGLINYLTHISPFKEITWVPKLEEGFVGGLFWHLIGMRGGTQPTPYMDNGGLVYPEGKSIPFSIIHQHNRDPYWWDRICRRYMGQDPLPTSRPTCMQIEDAKNNHKAPEEPKQVRILRRLPR